MAKSRKGACGKPMKKSRKGACGKTMKKSRKGGKAKKGACSKDIKFASSMKAKCFIKTKMAGKSVKAVGGIQHALGKKFKKAGFGTAEKLSCEAKTMTKRNFMRYMLEVLYSVFTYYIDWAQIAHLNTLCRVNKNVYKYSVYIDLMIRTDGKISSNIAVTYHSRSVYRQPGETSVTPWTPTSP